MKNFFNFIKTFAPFVLGGLFLFNVGKTSLEINQKLKRVTALESEVAGLRVKKATLEDNLAHINDPLTIERAARDQLQMVKPGEKIVILPGTNAGPSSTDQNVLGQNASSGPYYKEWWKLIFE